MAEVQKEWRPCPICGALVQDTYIFNDGMDWTGHHRGERTDRIILGQCTSCKPIEIQYKPMCLNCKSYSEGCCKNRETVGSISDFFDIPTPFLPIKDPTKRCDKYQKNMCVVLNNIIKLKEI